MKKKLKIEDKVLKTLQVLDELDRVEGNPFLYTRIQARMEKERAAKTSPTRQSAPILQYAMLSLLIVINVLTIRSNVMNDSSEYDPLIEALSEDYSTNNDSAADWDYAN